MPDDVSVRAVGIYKDFVLPHQRANSFKSMFTSAAKKHPKRSNEIQHALKDISFEVNKGEFFGIVGRNGSGKSTLLKIIAGIYQPNRGSVATAGKLVPFIELGVGFNPELSGRENVYLNGALLGFSKSEVENLYDDIVEFAGLERFMDQKLKNYSSGMQVRLAFSLAVRAKADILLIDEVLAVGDADFQRKCFDYFSQLKEEETTVIFVSHDMDAVRKYCDRAMLIEKNEIVAIGPTDKIAAKYLKLFAEANAKRSANDTPNNRWGDNSLRTTNIAIKTSGQTITITQEIEAKDDIKSPIAGIRICDRLGEQITGTNSKLENIKLPDFAKGQKATITWQLPNVLSDGEYSVDPALQHADLATVADWWNNAAYFTVKKDRQLPYAMDPGFVFKLEKKA